MAIGIVYACGFEANTIELVSNARRSGAAVGFALAKTGAVALDLGILNSYAEFPNSDLAVGTVYASAWIIYELVGSAGREGRYEFVLSDGKLVGLRRNASTGTYDLWVDGSMVKSGSKITPEFQYHSLQMKIVVGDSGYFESRINGRVDIEYDGDTKPGSGATVSYVRASNGGSPDNPPWFDDIVISTGDWPATARIFPVPADGPGDDAQWSSTEFENWDAVDDIPPNDSEYNSTSTDGLRDLVENNASFVSEGAGISAVVVWVRALSNAGESLHPVTKSGATLGVYPSATLGTSYEHIQGIWETNPDTGLVWTDQQANESQSGYEADI